jgi:hypothetical protein
MVGSINFNYSEGCDLLECDVKESEDIIYPKGYYLPGYMALHLKLLKGLGKTNLLYFKCLSPLPSYELPPSFHFLDGL